MPFVVLLVWLLCWGRLWSLLCLCKHFLFVSNIESIAFGVVCIYYKLPRCRDTENTLTLKKVLFFITLRSEDKYGSVQELISLSSSLYLVCLKTMGWKFQSKQRKMAALKWLYFGVNNCQRPEIELKLWDDHKVLYFSL